MQNRLKAVRESKNLSKLALSKMSGVSRVRITTLEAEPTTAVTSETMEKLAKALETPVTEIFLL